MWRHWRCIERRNEVTETVETSFLAGRLPNILVAIRLHIKLSQAGQAESIVVE